MAVINVEQGMNPVEGTQLRDTINLTTRVGNGIVINAYGGSDIIQVNRGDNHVINAGADNDFIDVSGGSNYTINLGEGDDTLRIFGKSGHKVTAVSGLNNITINSGSDMDITGGTGVDRLVIKGTNSNNKANLGAGEDFIGLATGTGNVLHAGAGNDQIIISGTGGEGNTIYGDAGDDKFKVYVGKNNTYSAGEGNDSILVTSSSNNTILGGNGRNQAIIMGGSNNTYYGGNEKDNITIKNLAQAVTVKAGTGATVVNIQAGNDHVINLGEGNSVTQILAGENIKIYGGSGKDNFRAWGTVKDLRADFGAGNDIIKVDGGTGMVIKGGTGDDQFNILSGKTANANNSFEGGEGKDTFNVNGGENIKVYGGDGNDTFVISGGKNITVVGGLGIDSFEFKNLNANTSYILDLSNDPKGDKETISVEGNSTDYYVKSQGNDVVLTNNEGGSLTIKGWSNQSCAKITFGDNSVYSKEKLLTSVPKVVINSQADVLKYFLTAMDLSTETGFALVDEAVNYASMGQYKNLEELVEEFKYACINYSTPDTYNDFLKEYCSMDLTNEDTGAITGADAGGAEVKTSKTVTGIPAGMKWSDLTYDNSKIIMAYDWDSAELDQFYAVKVNDFTLYWDEENWKSLKVDTEVLEQIIAGVTGIWGEKSIYLSGISYGMDFDDPYCYLPSLPDGSKGIQVILTNEDSDAMAYVQAETIASGELKGTSLEKLCINTKYYNKLLPDINGSSEESGLGLDRLIAHEMVHGVMFANIEGMGTMPVFIQEGLAEVVHGIDDYRTENIQVLVDSSLRRNFEDEQGHITYKDQEDTLNDVFDMKDVSRNEGGYSYAGGYTLLRYFAKQVYDKATGGSAKAVNTTTMVSNEYSNLMAAATGFAEAGAVENIVGCEALSAEDKLKITGNC